MVKRTGRPPNTSQEEILETALTLLREGGEGALSIRKLANKLGAAPTSIYNYFAGKDELLNALAGYALEAIPDHLGDDSTPWDQQIEEWMNTFRDALLAAPQLHVFISLAAKSPSILGIVAKIQQIASIIHREGLDEAAAISHAQGLVWTVMSFTYFESTARDPKIVEGFKTTKGLEPYTHIIPFLAVDNYDKLWADTVKRNIDGLRQQFRST